WKRKQALFEAVRRDPYRAFERADSDLRGDKEVALVVVGIYGPNLEHVSAALKDDEEVVERAIGNLGMAIGSASDRLKGNRTFIIKAILCGCKGLGFDWVYPFSRASAELRGDKSIAMLALGMGEFSLEHASAELQDDDEIVEL